MPIHSPARFPQVRLAGEAARLALSRLAEGICDDPTKVPLVETLLWAHVHGLASLIVDGPLATKEGSVQERDAHLTVVAEIFADQIMNTLPCWAAAAR